MNSYHSLKVSLLCFGFANFALAQNLVDNPGFEAYSNCPKNASSFEHLVNDVTLPSASSADYFNVCGGKDFSVPSNERGVQEAAEGQGYAGLYFYALNDYREYLQLNTLNTLREKYPYKISLKVSRAESSSLALKNMSVVLVNKKVRLPNSSAITASRLDLLEGVEFQEVKLTADNSMADKDGWVTLNGEFDAKGFENHILIGNFKSNTKTELIDKEGGIENSDFAYYYVDDLQLEALPKTNFETDKIYVLERNPYDPKGYDLDEVAMENVKKIFKYLKENAEVQMKITGHAAQADTPEYNQFVSSLRARAVALYLKKMGIDESRIVWEGVGETRPLQNGKIKDGLAGGRVEFVMTEVNKN